MDGRPGKAHPGLATRAQAFWRALLRSPGPWPTILLAWLLGLAFRLCPRLCPPAALILPWSAALLAWGRPRNEALGKVALGFWLYWDTLSILLNLFGLSEPRSPSSLAVFLSLGLHLAFLWTPVELGRALEGALRPLAGARRARLAAFGLALVMRMLPDLLLAARQLERTLDGRGRGLGFFPRTILLARGLVRHGVRLSEELGRALLSR
jgi:hypothetical protein